VLLIGTCADMLLIGTCAEMLPFSTCADMLLISTRPETLMFGMMMKLSVCDIELVDDSHDDGIDGLVLRLSSLPGGAAAANKHDIPRPGLHGIDRDNKGIFQCVVQPDVLYDLEFQTDEFFIFSRRPYRSDNLAEKHSETLSDGLYGLRHALVPSRTDRK